MDGLYVGVAVPGDLDLIISALGHGAYFQDRYSRQCDGAGHVLVARFDGQVVGAAYLWLAEAEEPELRAELPGAAILQRLEVLDGFRNRGVGAEIVLAAEALSAALGRPYLVLGVSDQNRKAIRLYERLGYRDWFGRTIATTREVFHPGGRSRRVPDVCLIYARRLDGVAGNASR